MKVFDLFNAEGRLFAFEVSNLMVRRRDVARIASSIPGAEVTRWPALFSFFSDEDEFCKFRIKDRIFVAWESWGDSNRYHIGQEPAGPCEELNEVRDAFVRARPFGL